MELGKWISKKDSLVMLELIHNSIQCKSEEKYGCLIEQFNKLVPFNSCVSVLTDFRHIFDRQVPINYIINNRFPAEYLDMYISNHYSLIDDLYLRFIKTLDVQYAKTPDKVNKLIPGHPVFKLRKDYGVDNLFIYGIRDYCMHSLTVLNIAGKQLKNDQRSKAIITHLTPYLSMTFKNLAISPAKRAIVSLTPKELEVLSWLKEGKTSWEISMILKRSESVINFHIENILKKLNATNRAHAIAIALDNHLLTL